MAKVHQPVEALHLSEVEPLFFLAGPIQGAPDWQKEAVQIIDDYRPSPTTHIANPRREYLDDGFNYKEQVTWEDRARMRAARRGALIFWLAEQDPEQPYEKGRPYAQTTRFEFGEVIGWLHFDPTIRVALGIDPGYSGSVNYYRHQAKRYTIPVHDTLSGTCYSVL